MTYEAEFRFPSRLAAAFHELFRSAVSDARHTATFEGEQLVLSLPAAHPAVGELTIWIDADEITVGIGEHFHCHFPTYLHDEPTSNAAEQEAAQEAAAFVRDVLDNRVVLHLHSEAGQVRWSGTYHLDRYPQRKNDRGTRQYLWSGPIEPA
jgi:hypothetical protein